MSTRREHESAISDRLPGEENIARLYQQAEHGGDEQPSEALDALVLAEARRAAQPRLRLMKGGRISQMTRRWAIPLSLAATLIVTIGVVTNLKDSPSPLVFSAPQAVPPTAQAPTPMTPELRETQKEQGAAKPLRQEKRRRNERNAALLEKAEEEADAALVAPAPSQEAMPQEEAESLFSDPGTGQQIRSADTKRGISDRSPKDWLADIGQLFQAGKRREAEDSLRAFQKDYPDYTDYPDSFPADVLERLRTPEAQPALHPR